MEIKNGVIGVSGITDVSGDVTLVKTQTDKIPAEVIKTATIVTDLTLPTKNLATNATVAQLIGNKTDDENGNSLYSKSFIVDKHIHTRTETYPYKAAAIVIVGGTGAWVEGVKTEIIPTATNSINTLTVTHICDAPGNVVIALDDINYIVPLVAGTINEVAAQLRAFSYIDPLTGDTYTITGADAEVIFTRLGRRTIARFTDVGTTTKVTATIVLTATGLGVGDSFDIHYLTPSAPTANTTYQLIFWKGLAGYEERISTKRLIRVDAKDAPQPNSIITPRFVAGERISASVATLAGTPDSISVGLEYHIY